MGKRYILFDLDGTLADTSEGIYGAFDAAVRELGLPPLEEDARQGLIGPAIKGSFARLYGLSDEEASRAADVFRTYYAQPRNLNAASLYPGVEDVLRSLQEAGYKLGVATNKREDCAEELLASFGIQELFVCTSGSIQGTFETKDAIVKRCVGGMGVTGSAEAVLVGDTNADYEAAEANDIDFIAVTYGFGFQLAQDVPGFLGVIDSMTQLESLLGDLND